MACAGGPRSVVLFHHIFVDGLPANDFMADRLFWARVFFMNGTFAVCLFFVISGFSLSISYLQTGDDRGLARMAAGRYVRLAVPIFAICAITYLLMTLNIIPPPAERPYPLEEVHAKPRRTVRILACRGICVPVQHRELRSATVDHVL